MSRIIAQLLNVPDVALRQLLDEWEVKSGRQSNDVRVVSDIRVRSRSALDTLGLDLADTTAEELYFALLDKVRNDNNKLAQVIGVDGEDTPEQLVSKIVSWIEKQKLQRDVWVIKPTIIKSALKKNPPKVLMKALGLRSADSMLKRNAPGEILPLAYNLEKPVWTSKFKAQFKTLSPSDFQVKPIELHVLSGQRAQKVIDSKHPNDRIVNPCNEAGSIVLVPPPKRFPNDVLSLTVTVLETMVELRRSSAYIRVLGVRGDFGERFHATATQGSVHDSRELSHIGWNSVHRHLVGNRDYFEGMEQPHLSYEDLQISYPAEILATAVPECSFWDGLEHVFYVTSGGRPVSMHLVDVTTNASNRASLSASVDTYARSYLWDELWRRYLEHPELSERVTGQFIGDIGIDEQA